MPFVLAAVTHTDYPVSANTLQGVLQVVANTQNPLRIARWAVYARSTSVQAEPMIAELVEQADAGAGSTAVTPKLVAPVGASVSFTAAVRFSTLPTQVGIALDGAMFHPQQGYEVMFGEFERPDTEGGKRVGIQVQSLNTVNVKAKIWARE